MRLIDVDKIQCDCQCQRCQFFKGYDIDGGCEIYEQPTAYDVDRVVEELNYIEMKWDKTCPPNNEYGEPMCDVDCIECQIRRCREIVKRGGIDDTDNR